MSFFKKLFSKGSAPNQEAAEEKRPVERRPIPSVRSEERQKRQPLPIQARTREIPSVVPPAPKPEKEVPLSVLAQELPETPNAAIESHEPEHSEAIQEPPASFERAPLEDEIPAQPEVAPVPSITFTAKQKAIREAKEFCGIPEDMTPFQIDSLLRRLHKRYSWVLDHGSQEQKGIAKTKLQAMALVKESNLSD